jgi:hypothetical protein
LVGIEKKRNVSQLPARDRLRFGSLVFLCDINEILKVVQSKNTTKDGTEYSDSGQLALVYFMAMLRGLIAHELPRSFWFEAPMNTGNGGRVSIKQRGFFIHWQSNDFVFGRRASLGIHSGVIERTEHTNRNISERLAILETLAKDTGDVALRDIATASEKADFSHSYWSDPAWRFWKAWYKTGWEGTPLPTDFLLAVSQIDDHTIAQGPQVVADAIREIEARFRTSVSVPLVRNEADTAFELADEVPLANEILEYIKERVGGALNTALQSGGSNGFDETCPEALAVARALQSVNPSAVAGLLNDASLMFQTNLGDVYPEDGQLIALQAAAFSGAEEICEIDEVARKRCLRAAKLFLRANPEPIDAEELVAFTDEIAKEATGQAADIIREDGRAIAARKRVGRFVRARFANYASTIVQWIDRTKKGVGRAEWLWKKVRQLMDVFEDKPSND